MKLTEFLHRLAEVRELLASAESEAKMDGRPRAILLAMNEASKICKDAGYDFTQSKFEDDRPPKESAT